MGFKSNGINDFDIEALKREQEEKKRLAWRRKSSSWEEKTWRRSFKTAGITEAGRAGNF